MKKKELIKKIAAEYDLDVIKVSEYFDSIFETLSASFIKNKSVNIFEFGKFKVKTKLGEEGEKQKTVQFSPVKKFAHGVNYNFNELSPMQIRVLDDKSLTEKTIEEEYCEDEIEEILLIDFGDKSLEVEKPEDILIPEETHQEIISEEIELKVVPEKEEILIPEETKQDILHEEIESEEEPKEEEKLLIPEITENDVLSEKIPHEITEATDIEVTADIIPETKGSVIKTETIKEQQSIKLDNEKIFKELSEIIFLDTGLPALEKEIEQPELISKDKKVISEAVTTIIPEEKQEELIPDLKEISKESEEIIQQEIPGIIEEKIEEKGDIQSVTEQTEKDKKETQDIFEEIIEEDEKGTFDTPKTNLELEAELLKILDERKKILEEIKKLESEDLEDLLEPTEEINLPDEQEQNLFDEDILDKPKQNIFVDENGKILENLLKDFKSTEELSEQHEDIIQGPVEDEEIIQEKEEEQKEEIIEDIDKEFIHKDIIEDIEKKEEIEDVKYSSEENIGNLENLFGSIYGEYTDKTIIPEPEENEPQIKNPEMNVFDKLLDEQIKEEDNLNKDITPYNKPENEFVTFKTEKTEESKPKEEKESSPIKKTEAIKTYDDIFNLIEPNGKKNGKKPEEVKKEEPTKKFPPILKLIIPLVILIIVIFIVVYIYERKVYKPYEEIPQTQTVDSTKTRSTDSIIYADTVKKEEAINEETVFEEEGFVIKQSEKGFFVHFGNFENQFELAKKIKELKEKNIIMEYEKITTEGKETYKIKAGPYKSLKEAKAVIPKL